MWKLFKINHSLNCSFFQSNKSNLKFCWNVIQSGNSTSLLHSWVKYECRRLYNFCKIIFLCDSYTGHCPQYKYRISDTFGSQTHKLLIDPCAGHSEKIILSDRTVDDYHIERPTLQEIDIVKNHERETGDPIYKYPTVPGYEGFVPRINGTYGQRFSVAATEGLAKFQIDCLKDRRKRNVLTHRCAMQEKLVKGRSLGERSVRILFLF